MQMDSLKRELRSRMDKLEKHMKDQMEKILKEQMEKILKDQKK
jgi:hypothetical protein